MKRKIFSLVLVIVFMISMLIGLTACGAENEDDEKDTRKGTNQSKEKETIFEDVEKEGNDKKNKLSNAEVKTFNASFEQYEGSQNANSVKTLLNEIVSSNTINDEKQIEVEMNGTTTSDSTKITSLKNKVVTTKKYEVSFEYASNGLIQKIMINDVNSSVENNVAYDKANKAKEKTDNAQKQEEEQIKKQEKAIEDLMNNF